MPPEKRSDNAGRDGPASGKGKGENWKEKIERQSRAIDKEMGYDEVTPENASEWLNARMNRIAQESHVRSEQGWPQLQAGLDFQRKMSRGVLPGSKETAQPSSDLFAPRSTRQTTSTRAAAQRQPSPEQDDKAEPLIGPEQLPQGSLSTAKQQNHRPSITTPPPPQVKAKPSRVPESLHQGFSSPEKQQKPYLSMMPPPPPQVKAKQSRVPESLHQGFSSPEKQQKPHQSMMPLPPPPQAKGDDKPDEADIQSAYRPGQRPRTKRRHLAPQSKEEVFSQQDDSYDQQAQSRKRTRANPLETNLGPNWDFHLVDGSRPTKARGNGYAI
ncbi:hypothetical protein PG994_001673 [Apiospora phragmitis]|uniref:Uncharacterized protein n=1 Tax=Apiospora phragmitis TaxID=2905665 RepID=A0ABR1WUA4_9PEZI